MLWYHEELCIFSYNIYDGLKRFGFADAVYKLYDVYKLGQRMVRRFFERKMSNRKRIGEPFRHPIKYALN